MRPVRIAAAIVRPVLVTLGVVGLLIEEVLWTALRRLTARLGRLPLISRIEAHIRALPPYGAMALFLLPLAAVLPLEMIATWLIARGHLLSGMTVLLAVKIAGMAVWAWLYALCHPALSGLRWFMLLETTLLRWKNWAHDHLERLESVRRARRLISGITTMLKSLRSGPSGA